MMDGREARARASLPVLRCKMALTTKIETEMICRIAVKRHGVELSRAEADNIHEKIILAIGETLDREILRVRDGRNDEKRHH